MKIRILLAFSALPLFFSQGTLACRVRKPLTDELKNKADTVFVGEAVAYTPPSKDRPPKPAVIRFRVEKILSGPASRQIEVYWINETFGESRSLKEFKKSYGQRTRVGITKAKGSAKETEPRDKPWVLQGPCTSPYLWAED